MNYNSYIPVELPYHILHAADSFLPVFFGVAVGVGILAWIIITVWDHEKDIEIKRNERKEIE